MMGSVKIRAVADLDLPPDGFAVVMATGIVAVAARDHAYARIDVALTVVTLVALVLLVIGAGLRLTVSPASTVRLARDPDVALRLFTFVAACTVVGARFAAHPAVVRLLAVVSAGGWVMLIPLAVRDVRARTPAQLRDHAHGSWLLISVATAGLAILAADLASDTHWQGWVVASAATWVLAVLLYLAITWLIGWRATAGPFVPEEVTPDSWILMGALAICTLAGAELLDALRVVGSSSWSADAVRTAILVLWILATLWIPVLLYAEIWRVDHRTGSMRFAGAWWSTVFPLGMYATATAATAPRLHLPALTTVSLVFFWIAFSVWVIIAVGWLHSVAGAALGARRSRVTNE